MLTVLLAFASVARVVRLRGSTQAVAYEVRQLRGRVAEMKNENAWRRADVARRTTLQELRRRAESVGLDLSIGGVVNMNITPGDAGVHDWSTD